jgi:uncharacterized membrane protein YfcA
MSLELAALIAAIGLLASFLSGLLGIGGGLVIIPLLLYVPEALGMASFDVKTASAVAVAQIATATGAGTLANLRRGVIYRRLAGIIVGGMVSGAFVGGYASQFMPSQVLLVFFATVATLGAASMLLPVGGLEAGPPQPSFNVAVAAACGVLVGIGIGLVGGGAFMLVPLQVYVLGIPTRTAIATGLAAGFPTAVSAFIGKALGGGVPLLPAVVACLPAVPGAQLGTLVGTRLPARVLRLTYATLILLVSAGLWYDVFNTR